MENKPKFSLVKWGALGLGVLLGVSHFSMIGLLSNRKTLPRIDLPVGPYTAYEVEASHDGYRISYRANDPKVMTVQKDIKTKVTSRVTEEETIESPFDEKSSDDDNSDSDKEKASEEKASEEKESEEKTTQSEEVKTT